MDIEKLKQTLGLQPLPQEGGYYAESYRSDEKLAANALPARYSSERALGTAIYFLLTADTFSGMHKLVTDEIYHFYLGDPVELLLLDNDGSGEVVTIGTRLADGMRPQVTVPRGTWQGSRLKPGGASPCSEPPWLPPLSLPISCWHRVTCCWPATPPFPN